MSLEITVTEAIENFLPLVDGAYDDWERDEKTLLEQNEGGPAITCAKGCGACCHFPLIPVTGGEAFVLLQRLLASGTDFLTLRSSLFDYVLKYYEHAVAQKSLPFTDAQQFEFLALKLPCPLFKKEPELHHGLGGSCSVFKARPLICNYYHSLDSPTLCHQKQPHRSLGLVVGRGIEAVDELRRKERKFMGRSALGHLPLLMASLCTEEGLKEFLKKYQEAETVEDQELCDFEFLRKLLSATGYEISENDLSSLQEAQKEFSLNSEEFEVQPE